MGEKREPEKGMKMDCVNVFEGKNKRLKNSNNPYTRHTVDYRSDGKTCCGKAGE